MIMILIIIPSKNELFWNKTGDEVQTFYRTRSKFFTKLLRFLDKLGFRLIRFFYNTWYQETSLNTKIVLFDSCIREGTIKNLIKYKKPNLYIYFWNKINTYNKKILDLKNEYKIFTYDLDDTDK